MQHAGKGAVAAVFCLTVAGACGDAPFGPSSELLIAEAAASAWVRQHPVEWSSQVTSREIPTRPEWTPPCSAQGSNGYVSLRLATVGGDIEFAFRCPLDEHATPELLERQFIVAVPSQLPVGLDVPNWRFQSWLANTSIYDGVTFHTSADGSLAVDIRSAMLGIRGASTRRGCMDDAYGVVAEADLSDANGTCFIRRTNPVPMVLRFNVPADFSALR